MQHRFFFRHGMTTARLETAGTISLVCDVFVMMVISGTSSDENCLSSQVGMGSSSHDLQGATSRMTSDYVTGAKYVSGTPYNSTSSPIAVTIASERSSPREPMLCWMSVTFSMPISWRHIRRQFRDALVSLFDVEELFFIVPAIDDLSRIVLSRRSEQQSVDGHSLRSIRLSIRLGQFRAKSVQLAAERVSRTRVRRCTTSLVARVRRCTTSLVARVRRCTTSLVARVRRCTTSLVAKLKSCQIQQRDNILVEI